MIKRIKTKVTGVIDNATRAFRRVDNKLRDSISAVKYAYQRAIHGWCKRDCWDFSYWFCSTAPKILRHFSHNCIGHPCSPEIKQKMHELFPGYKPENAEDPYFELWGMTIRYLSDLIENSHRETCKFVNDVECPKNTHSCVEVQHVGKDKLYEVVKNQDVADEFDNWVKAEDEIDNKVLKTRDEMFDLLKLLFDSLWD